MFVLQGEDICLRGAGHPEASVPSQSGVCVSSENDVNEIPRGRWIREESCLAMPCL